MKRETAKKLIETFNDEELQDLGIKAGRDVIRHYANGGKIAYQGMSDWRDDFSFNDHPSTYKMIDFKYRLFGIEIEGVPPLRLHDVHEGQIVWSITPEEDNGYDSFKVDIACGYNDYQKNLINRGTVFATEEGAKTAAKALGWYKEKEDE